MKNLNIIKSNKNSSFQRFIDGKVVLGIKAFSKYDIPYPENACLVPQNHFIFRAKTLPVGLPNR